MTSLRECTKLIVKNVVFIIVGALTLACFSVFLSISLPLYVYRWIITKIAAPCFKPKFGKAVTVPGHPAASEFRRPDIPPRNTLVVNFIAEGHISYEELYDAIDKKWIKARTNQGVLKYPELQQYLKYWMGYMFWKQDASFNLKNHINLHKVDGNNDEDSEKFLCQLTEELVNITYCPKRSPWELHLVHNYRNSSLHQEKGLDPESNEMTILILRIHHSMADGFSILKLTVGSLMENSIENLRVAVPGKRSVSVVEKVIGVLAYPIKFIWEAGYMTMQGCRRRTPLHIPDKNKSWTQIYGRGSLIKMNKIKFVKDTFGVSFTAVVNSCLSAGLSHILDTLMNDNVKQDKRSQKNLLFGSPMPAPNHPAKLRNKTLAVALSIPARKDLNAVHRLYECEQQIQRAKNSPMQMITLLGLRTLSSHLASSHMIRNRILGTGVSSFPGPGVEIMWKNKRILALDFAAGALEGVCGVGFMALSYVDSIRICATAENAVLSRDQLNELICSIYNEFDVLYDLALSTNNDMPNSAAVITIV